MRRAARHHRRHAQPRLAALRARLVHYRDHSIRVLRSQSRQVGAAFPASHQVLHVPGAIPAGRDGRAAVHVPRAGRDRREAALVGLDAQPLQLRIQLLPLPSVLHVPVYSSIPRTFRSHDEPKKKNVGKRPEENPLIKYYGFIT